MTAVAGLDLSLTSSGVTVLTDDLTRINYKLPTEHPRPGCVYPTVLRNVGIEGHDTDGWRERSRRIRAVSRGVTNILNAQLPLDLGVIEAMLPVTKTFYSYGDRWALWHAVYGWFDAKGIPIAVIHNQHGHQFVTGLGRVSEDKHEVIDATAKWWPGTVRVPNHDLGDALGLAMMGVMHLGGTPPFRPGARHYNAVHSCEWPGRPKPVKTWAQHAKVKKARRG
jgi:hypothetical protein